MGEKKSLFQIVILSIFGMSIVGAVLYFAGLGGRGGNSTNIGEVVMWGTVEEDTMENFLRVLGETDDRVRNITYIQYGAATYEEDLVEALASGDGPDVFIIDEAHILRHWTKVQPISYDTFSERQFLDTYIGEGQLFLSTSGVRAVPMVVDPMVLYWNRDIFAETGFAQPPSYWDELFLMAEQMSTRTKANIIERAAIALGDYENITHAKDIIATLILQAGGNIVARNELGNFYAALLPNDVQNSIWPAQSALRFYIEFANPAKSVYTWSPALPDSIDMFAQSKLGMYVGYASDLPRIQAKNPNLNFDVAPLPQIRASETRRVLTGGRMYALAVPRVAQNQFGAFQIISALTNANASTLFSAEIGLPSARRDVLATRPTDPIESVFRDAALISAGWNDPYAEKTYETFKDLVQSVTSGSSQLSAAITRANEEISDLLNR